MDNADLIPLERWKDVPIANLKYRYRASTLGRIVKVMPDGEYVFLKPTIDRAAYNYSVRLRLDNGKVVKKCIHTIVGETFLGKRDGYRFYLKNGVKTDTRLSNIGYATSAEILRMNNQKKRIPTAKIDKNGEIVEVYKSLRYCAKQNHFSEQAMSDICNGKNVNVLTTDGYAYCFEDDSRRMKKIREILASEVMNEQP